MLIQISLHIVLDKKENVYIIKFLDIKNKIRNN